MTSQDAEATEGNQRFNFLEWMKSLPDVDQIQLTAVKQLISDMQSGKCCPEPPEDVKEHLRSIGLWPEEEFGLLRKKEMAERSTRLREMDAGIASEMEEFDNEIRTKMLAILDRAHPDLRPVALEHLRSRFPTIDWPNS